MQRIIFIALLAIAGCAPVYVPNLRNSPMFTKGGEFQASLQIGNGFEGQTAYAVSDHFGVMANYAYINESSADDVESYHRHRFFEGGIGYFSNKENSFFEVFAGYGRGKGSSYDEFEFFGSQTIAATGEYERYLIQPAFGMSQDKVQLSFVPRVSMVDFFKFSTELYETSIAEKPVFFFEPGIVLRYNFSNNRTFVVLQTGASLKLSDDIYFERRRFQVGGGFGFRLGGVRELTSRL
jgi:hypothetical protein